MGQTGNAGWESNRVPRPPSDQVPCSAHSVGLFVLAHGMDEENTFREERQQ